MANFEFDDGNKASVHAANGRVTVLVNDSPRAWMHLTPDEARGFGDKICEAAEEARAQGRDIREIVGASLLEPLRIAVPPGTMLCLKSADGRDIEIDATAVLRDLARGNLKAAAENWKLDKIIDLSTASASRDPAPPAPPARAGASESPTQPESPPRAPAARD